MAPNLGADNFLTASGYLGVDFFFILSGFIITHTYRSRISVRDFRTHLRFLELRLARMYPVHIFTLLALGVLVMAARVSDRDISGDFSASSFVRQVTLTSIWGPFKTFSWNYPSWSISAEWAAYISFPLLALILARAKGSQMVALGAVSALATILAVTSALGHSPSPIERIGIEFTVGMFLHDLYRGPLGARMTMGAPALTSVAVAIVAAVSMAPPDWKSALIVPGFSVIILALAVSDSHLNERLTPRWLRFLGEASYSLYMTHALVEMVGSNVLPMEGRDAASIYEKVGVVVAYVIALSAAAVGTYLLVERPSRERWRRSIQQRYSTVSAESL